MIALSFNTAFMLYLGFTLVILLAFWGYNHFRDRKRVIVTHEQKLIVCEFCHFAFLDKSFKDVNQCPQCHSFVKLGKK
jgi:uncharacterized paraquat-inducible protein A